VTRGVVNTNRTVTISPAGSSQGSVMSIGGTSAMCAWTSLATDTGSGTLRGRSFLGRPNTRRLRTRFT
jgi:hypothetical protein